jgi:hypothetical protein
LFWTGKKLKPFQTSYKVLLKTAVVSMAEFAVKIDLTTLAAE